MKITRLITAIAILAGTSGAYAAGAADNAWLVQAPAGQQPSAPAPTSASTPAPLGTHFSGAADNAWLMQTTPQQGAAPAPGGAASEHSSIDMLDQAVVP